MSQIQWPKLLAMFIVVGIFKVVTIKFLVYFEDCIYPTQGCDQVQLLTRFNNSLLQEENYNKIDCT